MMWQLCHKCETEGVTNVWSSNFFHSDRHISGPYSVHLSVGCSRISHNRQATPYLLTPRHNIGGSTERGCLHAYAHIHTYIHTYIHTDAYTPVCPHSHNVMKLRGSFKSRNRRRERICAWGRKREKGEGEYVCDWQWENRRVCLRETVHVRVRQTTWGCVYERERERERELNE